MRGFKWMSFIFAIALVESSTRADRLFDEPGTRAPDVKRLPAPASQPAISATSPSRKPTTATTVATRPAAAEEPDPSPLFAQIFGAEARRVDSTTATRDDVEFARKLIESGKQSAASPKFQRLVYERAADYAGRDPAGITLALQIIDLLRAQSPNDSAVWAEKSLALYDKLYRTTPPADRLPLCYGYLSRLQSAIEDRTLQGKYNDALSLCKKALEVARLVGPEESSAIGDLQKAVTEQQRFDKRAQELTDTLANASKMDAAAVRELVDLLTGVLGRPGQAMPYRGRIEDRSVDYAIGLANLRNGELTPAHAVWLGDWFRACADKSPAAIRPPLLRRSCAYYAQYLALHPTLDTERLKVMISARQAAEMLAKLDKSPRLYSFELPSQAVPLLYTVSLDRHKSAGTWTVKQGEMTGEGGVSLAQLILPVAPGESYELTLQFAGQGTTAVGLILPVGTGTVAISRSATGCTLLPTHPMAAGLLDLAKDFDRHTLYVRVVTHGGEAGIFVAIDGAETGRWQGSVADLGLPATLAAASRSAICLFTSGGPALFSDISLHVLRGETRLVSVPAPTDIPADGSRPRDVIFDKPSTTSTRIYHNLVTATFDPAITGGLLLSVQDPRDEIRQLRAAFTAMMALPTNLAPLRMDAARYRRLVSILADAPRGWTESDALRVKQIWHDHESAVTADARQRAEQFLFITLHGIGDRHRKAATAWARYVEQNASTAELQLMSKFLVK